MKPSVLESRLRVIQAASENVGRLDAGVATVHELVHGHVVLEKTNLGRSDQTMSMATHVTKHPVTMLRSADDSFGMRRCSYQPSAAKLQHQLCHVAERDAPLPVHQRGIVANDNGDEMLVVVEHVQT